MIEPWEKYTLSDLLYRAEKKHGDKVAVIDRENRFTYTQLLNKVKKLASYFYINNIKKGDRVILQLQNSALFEIISFALFEIGALPILILPAHREHVVDAICGDSQPVAYITMNEFYGTDYEEEGKRMKEKHSSIRNIYTVNDLEYVLNDVDVRLVEYERPFPKDLAFLSLSGGTTGIPKLIPRTQGDYSYNAIVTAKHCRLDENTVNLSAIPVAHNFAFGTPGIIGTIYAGGTNVMCEYPSPVEIFDWIENEHVTIMSLVPAVANLCVQYRQVDDGYDISSLKYLLVGGSVFSPSQAELLEEVLHTTIIQVYGMSEGMTFLTEIDANDEVRYMTQGKPCAKEDIFLIVDKNFNEVQNGEEGEVIVKGPYTIKNYYKNEEADKKNFKNGFYRPGDKGIMHSSGNIIITGRVKELINRAGEKIMPSEIEKCFLTIPSVCECVAAGIKDEVLGEAICVFYKGNNKLHIRNVAEFFRNAKVEDYCIPDKLMRVEQWPFTAVGKIDKNALKGLLGNGY